MNTATIEAHSATALHLSRLVVPYRDAIGSLRIRDSYDWHQRIWDLFGRRDGQQRDFLFRVERQEEAFRVLVLSQSPATKLGWCQEGCFRSKQIPDAYLNHNRYRFSLLANLTKKVAAFNADGTRRKNGRRVPLATREDLVAWMERKAKAGGFVVDADTLRTIPGPRESFHKNGTSQGTHTSVEFQGLPAVTVTDHEEFRTTVANGIGSAKSFGFGMLVLTPIFDL